MAHRHRRTRSMKREPVSIGCPGIEAFETQATFVAWVCRARQGYSTTAKSRTAGGIVAHALYDQHAGHVHHVRYASHEYHALREYDSSSRSVDSQSHGAYVSHARLYPHDDRVSWNDLDVDFRSPSQPHKHKCCYYEPPEIAP